jgi:hypothetical protein
MDRIVAQMAVSAWLSQFRQRQSHKLPNQRHAVCSGMFGRGDPLRGGLLSKVKQTNAVLPLISDFDPKRAKSRVKCVRTGLRRSHW